MKITDIITINKEIQSGTPVFKGTRVPIQSLFWHLESGVTIDEFLEDFPSVTKKQVIQLLELSNKMVNTPQIIQLYETVA
ncbi:MAG: DUF433 domain-containing protein [Acidobacteria bacterium]|jgi:uncharacterized protein (DUF433 family)|nr:DUF433 domain-containing protein [Acidobacteriota bacterium]MBA3692446.1 DUF433 domain-containing protein [Acidobacteriota bacterium]